MGKSLNIARILAAQRASGINPEEEKIRVRTKTTEEERMRNELRLKKLKSEVEHQARLIARSEQPQEVINDIAKKNRKLYNPVYKGMLEEGSLKTLSQWEAEYAIISHPIAYLRHLVMLDGIDSLDDINGISIELKDRIQHYNTFHPADKLSFAVVNDTRHILKNLEEYTPDLLSDYKLLYIFKGHS